MIEPVDPTRNLLFGLIALQVGIIDQARLVAAFQAWTLDRSRPLADHLVALGHIDDEDRAAVESLVGRHIRKHGGDAEGSLAAVPVGRSTREALADIGGPEVEATLRYMGPEPVSTRDSETGADRTASYVIGTATSEGHRFRVLRPHASGALGAVFIALDTELHREVALKQILDAHADDAASRARFLIEAEITGGLEHPGIVPVYGLGTYGDGRPYYAMRFIRGDSLKERIRRFHEDRRTNGDPGRRSLEFRKLLRCFTDVCNAIDYAHSRGVLHRDIKPGNVVVGRHGETLVVDWGLAKAMGRAEAASETGERTLMPNSASGSAETLPGSALGTPAYMSPEQAEGNLEQLGPRSDVYSLGATLYCLLTGRPPLSGDVPDVIRAVQRGDIRPPRQLDPSIDPALEAVCRKAMAHKPADRYASPRELSEDVERWLADEPVCAWREPPWRRTRRWARRHRTAVTASAAAVLVALAGTVAILAVQTRANRALAASNDQLRDANERLRLANSREGAARARAQARFDLAKKAIEAYYTGASEDVLLKQPELEDLRNRLLRTALDFYRELGSDLDADREAGLDSKARGDLARASFRVAWITREIGNVQDALAAFQQTLAVRREIVRLEPANLDARREMANCLSHIGWLLFTTSHPDESRRRFRESAEILERVIAERADDELARDYLGWNLYDTGVLEMQSGRHEEARRSLQRALEIRRALATSHPDKLEQQTNIADTLHDLGGLAQRDGRSDEAMSWYRQVLEIKKRLAEDHPGLTGLRDRLAAIYNDMANVIRYQDGGKPESMRLYREAMAIREELVRDHPTVSLFRARLASGHYNLGLMEANEGHWDAASERFRQARALREALVRANPAVAAYRRGLTETQFSLAYVSRRLGRTDEAAEAYRAVRDAWERLSQEDPSNPMCHEELARCLESYAGLFESEGKVDEAIATHRQALDSRRRLVRDHPTNGPNRRELSTSQFLFADLLAASGRVEEARRVQDEALAIREALVRDAPELEDYQRLIADGQTRIARLEVRAGRAGEAIRRLDRAREIVDRLAAANRRGASDSHDQSEFQLVLGEALEGTGDLGSALRAYERSRVLMEKMPALYSAQHFHLACVYARLSALATRRDPASGLGGAGERESHAAKAVAELRRALAARYANPARLRTEPDLNPLRLRPDFRLLLMDVAFPYNPFAG
jgi:serine/threonine-protein kinase